ncbi:MAG: hypothetical protein J6128_00545 [Clostridia bacterium]|nr:hypothetical protein [Clostridia bacterium]
MTDMLKEMAECCPVSGREGRLLRYIKSRLEKGEAYIDGMGNLAVTVKGREKHEGGSTVFAVGCDIPGFFATSVSEDGKVYFSPTFPVEDLSELSGRTVVYSGKEYKILSAAKDAEKTRLTDLYVDAGVPGASEFRPGTWFSFRSDIKEEDGKITGICCSVLSLVKTVIDAVNSLEPEYDTGFLFSVMKIQGGRGLASLGYDFDVGRAVILRASEIKKDHPTVLVKDCRLIPPSGLVRLLTEAAGKAGVPYDVSGITGRESDLSNAVLSGRGNSVISVVLPASGVLTDSESVTESSLRELRDLILAVSAV